MQTNRQLYISDKAKDILDRLSMRKEELQGDWTWQENDDCYSLFAVNDEIGIYTTIIENHTPMFGYYKTEEVAEQIASEFAEDILWYANHVSVNIKKVKKGRPTVIEWNGRIYTLRSESSVR